MWEAKSRRKKWLHHSNRMINFAENSEPSFGSKTMLKTIIFVVSSLGILLYSWPSMRNVRAHGFFRFFAFEGILGLILLNIGKWFNHPFSLQQLISWPLLCASIFLAIHSFYLLRIIGRPSGNFENTTGLVRIGAYKYIRHPLYSSLLFLGWGAFFKSITPGSMLLVAAITVFLFATARTEEAENLAKFGQEYTDYKKSTRMFVPFVF
jgi:protein-S-isoprenylcysteine O-methyltransferase Ste14